MLAVFKTGGKQYSVKTGQILEVEKLEGKKGDSISFKDVLTVTDDSENMIGAPLVKGAVVEAKILNQIRDKKIIVFKKRRRQNYRSTRGHRQYLTVLKIESISIGSNKSITSKKEIKKEVIVEAKEKKQNAKVKGSGVSKKTSPKKKEIVKKRIKKATIKNKIKKDK